MSDWRIDRLGNVATLQRGFDLPVQERLPGTVPIFAANGAIGVHQTARVDGPGVVTGRSGSIGKVHYVEDDFWPLNTSLYVRDFHGNDPKYVFWLLREVKLDKYCTGTGVPTLNRNVVHEVQVPVPPLDEQRRIAAILDHADELRTRRDITIGLIGNLRQSIFIDMFGVADRVAKNWECAPLSDLADTCSGGTPSRSDNSYYGGDIPWVKSGEVAQGSVLFTEETITEAAVANSSAKVMPPGTVLVAMYGATAGKVGVLGISAATNQAVCSITPGARLRVGYLVEVLRSMNDHLLAQRSGGAQPNLSQGVIRGLQIPVPPIEFQDQFCRRVAEVDAIEVQAVAALARHSGLFQSLQARAFAGQL